jgi:hypothetical protein
MMRITRKNIIFVIIALVIVVSVINYLFISTTSITGSAVTQTVPAEFPGLSLAIILAGVLGGFLVIRQHHTIK